MILTRTSALLRRSSEWRMGSMEPWTSVLRMMLRSLSWPARISPKSVSRLTGWASRARAASRWRRRPPTSARAPRPSGGARQGAGAAVRRQLRLDDCALGRPVRVRLQLLDLGDEEDVLQQVVDALAGAGGDRHGRHLAAVLLDDHLVLGELLQDAVRVGAGGGDLVGGEG